MTKNNIYTIGYTLFQRESNFDLEGMYKIWFIRHFE